MEQTLLIRNIRREPDASDEAFVSSCKKRWGIPADEPLRFRIVRQALDARKKQDICFVVHAEITADNDGLGCAKLVVFANFNKYCFLL